MQLSKVPTWVLLVFGAVAVIAGVLGVVHAPPAIGKATWAIVTVLGVVSLVVAAIRGRAGGAVPGR